MSKAHNKWRSVVNNYRVLIALAVNTCCQYKRSMKQISWLV